MTLVQSSVLRSLGLSGSRSLGLARNSRLAASARRPAWPSLMADSKAAPIYVPKRHLSLEIKEQKGATNRMPIDFVLSDNQWDHLKAFDLDQRKASTPTSDKQIPVDFIFSDQERDQLKSALVKISVNPYKQYDEFEKQIDSIIASNAVVDRLRDICARKRSGDIYEDPYVYLKNCPVDDDLPKLSFESPVDDKRNLKKTYVSEGFLLLYAKLMRQEPIGYINVNDGDIFQDIHPMRRMSSTQSQKALDTIFFHKDLANHFVRPDWVNILGLRSSPANKIFTSFVRNKDLLEALPEETKECLRQELFYTPYDDLTASSDNAQLGDAPNHRILGGATDYDIRFFENRTIGLNDQAREAVTEVLAAMHRLKQPLTILKGDFIGSANNECVHNKELGEIGDPEAQQNRWLMKTVNVAQLRAHQQHMVEGESRIVNG